MRSVFICNLLVAYQQTMRDTYMQPYGCSFRETSDVVGIFGEDAVLNSALMASAMKRIHGMDHPTRDGPLVCRASSDG
jgi:hypothetical protein